MITLGIILTSYLLFGILLFIFTWLGFKHVMKHKDELDKFEGLKDVPPNLYFTVVVGSLAWIGDVLWNIFYATPAFLQLPDFHRNMDLNDLTLSHRLRQILRNDTSITKGMVRWEYADLICGLIETKDPTHCGRNNK